MELVHPSPGKLFDASAVATKKLEHLSMTLGTMVNIVREITTLPLSASQRVLVIEAFKSLSGLDPWAQALDHTLNPVENFRRQSRSLKRRT
jgi:hypothetical protein